MERKRKVEREMMKEGLRVWLERKAGEIRRKRKGLGEGVGTLVWRFTKRAKMAASADKVDHVWQSQRQGSEAYEAALERGRVSGLKRFWEGLGDGDGRMRA